MKKIKYWFQKYLFQFCLDFSREYKMEYSIMGNRNSYHHYHFFNNFGPKMLIIRDDDIFYLGSALQIEAKFDNKGRLEYCRPMCMNTQKGDRVFYGKRKVYKEWERERYKPRFTGTDTSGLTICL